MFVEMMNGSGGGGSTFKFKASGNFSGGNPNTSTVSGLSIGKKYLLIICGAGSSVSYAEQFSESLTSGTGYTYSSVQTNNGSTSSSMVGAISTYIITPTATSITLTSSQTATTRKMCWQLFEIE